MIATDHRDASAAQPRLLRYASIEQARAEWTALAAKTANVFSTWEWADIWWRHFGDGKSSRVAAVQVGEEIEAVLPVHQDRRRGVCLLRFIGHGVADQLGPVCGPDSIAAASAALGAIISAGGIMLAERLPADRDWGRELRGTVVRREPSPSIDLLEERDFEGYLGARSANFRQQVRRRARNLQRGEGVCFRLADDPARLQRDLDVLVALHAARWGGACPAFDGPREAFHREFAAIALDRGWLRLWFAEIAGAPVAAWYGFRFAGVDSFYQSGRDPDWDRSRVGAGLLEHTIREAFADGMREYRLLRGDEVYKRRYATQDTEICTVAAAGRPPGRAVVGAVDILLRHGGRRLLGSADG